jgi:hypothetical protein
VATVGRGRQGVSREAELLQRGAQIGRDVPDQEAAPVELAPNRLERGLRCHDVGALEPVAQRGERVVSVVIDGHDRPASGDAARRANVSGHPLHGGVEHLGVGHPRRFDAEALRERPPGVVVGCPLRIVGGPVLVVQQRVGDAGVGLVPCE